MRSSEFCGLRARIVREPYSDPGSLAPQLAAKGRRARPASLVFRADLSGHAGEHAIPVRNLPRGLYETRSVRPTALPALRVPQ
jgi:hypothetical protein